MTKIIPPSPPTSNSKEEVHIDPYMNNLDLDILIVGAGFSGIHLLYNLRKKGYKVKIFEGSNGLGGTWQINRYPGARVDSDQPVYQLSIPQIWKEWTWKEKFPGSEEIRQYFDFCDKILDIKKDVAFNTKVIAANFKKSEGKWMIKTNDGRITKAKYFLPCIGFAAKRYIPDFPGIETFKGKIYHSSEWPKFEVDVSEKRCAVIGTGASGVQITQEWGKRAKSLVVFQRTPNLCLPMSNRNLTAEEQNIQKHEYQNYFLRREAHFGGFVFGFLPRDTFEDTEEEREKVFEALWNCGNMAFWIGGYQDIFFKLDANYEAYKFWAKKTRSKIEDPQKRDILAPLEPPHPFGTKLPSLEQDYYQMFNKTNVDVVSLKENPIIEIKPNGILTSDGKLHEIDILALATGFDFAGGLLKIDLTDINDIPLSEHWSNGTKTFQGISISNFPNMFYTYGPQAPTAFSNGPTLIEIQADWIIKVIDYCEEKNVKYIVAKEEAQEKWSSEIHETAKMSLFPLADSWYMGANIPGKKREMLNFLGGVPKYAEILKMNLKNDLEGYELVSN